MMNDKCTKLAPSLMLAALCFVQVGCRATQGSGRSLWDDISFVELEVSGAATVVTVAGREFQRDKAMQVLASAVQRYPDVHSVVVVHLDGTSHLSVVLDLCNAIQSSGMTEIVLISPAEQGGGAPAILSMRTDSALPVAKVQAYIQEQKEWEPQVE